MGIPHHLHQLGRPEDPDFDREERLWRRFRFAEADLTAAIKFDRMSVNREKHGNGPDDALWNCDEGGRFREYGVIEFRTQDLAGPWCNHKTGRIFELYPEHVPERCNYPHSEVAMFESDREGAQRRAVCRIKPSSVKMSIREHLQPLVKIVRPLDRKGETLPLKPK